MRHASIVGRRRALTGRSGCARAPHAAPVPSFLVAALTVLMTGSALAGEPQLAAERQRFEAADAVLNQLYAEAAREFPELLFEQLRLDQRRWLAQRDPYAEQVANLQGAAEAGLETDEPWFWLARTERTEGRAQVLRGWLAYAREGSPGVWEGVWVDGYGGRLLVAEGPADRVVFALLVVRGPTFHLGEIAGVAERNVRTARFVTEPLFGEGRTWLTFVRDGPWVRVVAENAESFHGMRAYFDGLYVRVDDLTPEDRDALAAVLE